MRRGGFNLRLDYGGRGVCVRVRARVRVRACEGNTLPLKWKTIIYLKIEEEKTPR
jgi:hypothetical protein